MKKFIFSIILLIFISFTGILLWHLWIISAVENNFFVKHGSVNGITLIGDKKNVNIMLCHNETIKRLNSLISSQNDINKKINVEIRFFNGAIIAERNIALAELSSLQPGTDGQAREQKEEGNHQQTGGGGATSYPSFDLTVDASCPVSLGMPVVFPDLPDVIANVSVITFNSAGGTAIDSIKLPFGSPVTAPAAPTRDGFTFTGWNPVVPATMPLESVICVALWKANDFTITFNSAGGTAIDSIKLPFGSAVTAPANPVLDGHVFVEWQPAVPTTMPREGVICVALWKAINYTITFDSAGGSAVALITQGYETAVTPPAAPAKDGFTFTGWNPAVPPTMPQEDVTCVAQWKAKESTIVFDSAGGSAVVPIRLPIGSAVTPPAAPAKDGFTFTEWNPAVPTTMPVGGKTCVAQWSRKGTPTLPIVNRKKPEEPAMPGANIDSISTAQSLYNESIQENPGPKTIDDFLEKKGKSETERKVIIRALLKEVIVWGSVDEMTWRFDARETDQEINFLTWVLPRFLTWEVDDDTRLDLILFKAGEGGRYVYIMDEPLRVGHWKKYLKEEKGEEIFEPKDATLFGKSYVEASPYLQWLAKKARISTEPGSMLRLIQEKDLPITGYNWKSEHYYLLGDRVNSGGPKSKYLSPIDGKSQLLFDPKNELSKKLVLLLVAEIKNTETLGKNMQIKK